MTVGLLLELACKSAVVAATALFLLALLKRRSAAERAFVAHAGLALILLLPIVSLAAPRWHVAPATSVAEVLDRTGAIAPVLESQLPAEIAAPGSRLAKPTAATVELSGLFPWAYAVPAALLLVLTFIALVRLRLLHRRSQVVIDPVWLTALARAQRRMNVKHGTALLVSDRIRSPVSWGIMRPVILLDQAAATRPGQAEAIIAHELAHVARLDWLKLLIGRVTAALFWFNPLVWALARQAHELSEEAADDAVLRSDLNGADYAELLVQAARYEAGGLLLAANGVAPAKGSLGRRIERLLDPTSSRAPARLAWASLCCVATLGVGAPVAALTLETPPEPNQAIAAPLERPGLESLHFERGGDDLIEAARAGRLGLVKALIARGFPVDTTVPGDGSPLIVAAARGHLNVVRHLLDRGASIDLAVHGDGNPLIKAAANGELEVVRLLLNRGANVEALVPSDENALMNASYRGHAEVVRLLIDRGADVNSRSLASTPDGPVWRTPLTRAREGGHHGIVRMLVSAGAVR